MLIGIFGGTFDPIHEGHLHVARYLLKHLPLDSVRIIPCFSPVHRNQPVASADDRLSMIEQATEMDTHIIVDTREIDRAGPSYMIDTLTDLQQEFPNDTLCLILGDDAFEKFDHWHRWREIITLCHVIVVHRPSTDPHYRPDLQAFIQEHQRFEKSSLSQSGTGVIYYCNLPPMPISATEIREQLRRHENNIKGLPPAVDDYIIKHNLYDK